MVSAIDGTDGGDPDKRRSDPASQTPSSDPASAKPRILVVDADPATQSLLEEWLTEHGCQVQSRRSEDNARPSGGCCQERQVNGFDLALVDVPFPRQGLAQLERVAQAHPGTPIVAMSSTFFASVECTGAVARMLGVAGVLPKPLRREALTSALRTLLSGRR
jgi:CheY-like chemotaxis protein